MLVLPVIAFQILNGLNTADCVRQSVRGMILKERVVLKPEIVYRNDWRFEIISGSRHKIKKDFRSDFRNVSHWGPFLESPGN